jgi:hypothetical protein
MTNTKKRQFIYKNYLMVIPRLDRGIQTFQRFLDTRLQPAGMTGTASLFLIQVLLITVD